MTMKGTYNSDAVERTVSHDERIRNTRNEFGINLPETGRTRHSSGVNAVNANMQRIEPFVRINQGLPGSEDNPGSHGDKPELTDAGAISIRGLDIKSDERRERNRGYHRQGILTIQGKTRRTTRW